MPLELDVAGISARLLVAADPWPQPAGQGPVPPIAGDAAGVPRGWIGDADRRQAAGVPEQVGFATKPELARVVLARALAAGVPAAWVTADEVYGGSPALRAWLEAHRLPQVLALRCTEPLQPTAGAPTPAAGLAEAVPPERWLTINAGDGAKGRRWYAWTRVKLAADGPPAGWDRWLLVRRHLRTSELAF
jgi:hypothetical protein